MTAPTPATPAPAAPVITLDSALANLKALIAAQPEPARTDLIDGLRYVELFAEQEVDAAIMNYAHKIPLAGGLIGTTVANAFDAAIRAGLIAVIGPVSA